jgi:hypothetical protein
MDKFDITWLHPIRLKLADEEDRQSLIRRLSIQIEDEANIIGLERSVYIIRMAGSFVIQYPEGPSPVVYIGRGDSVSRLASHLKTWASDVFVWGSDTEIEIRILRPARRNRTEYYKNVEADLLEWFRNRYGILPLINSRYETNWAGAVEYGPSQESRLRQVLGIGRGLRPKWAIQPLNSKKLYQKYLK